MDTLRRRIVTAFAVCVLPVAAWAEWRIPAGPVALFKPTEQQYVLVLGKPLAQALQGWEALAGKANAYTITSAEALGIERTTEGWLIAANTPAAPEASALLLNQSWKLADRSLQRTEVAVNGSVWQVGLTPFRQRAAGAVLGVAQRTGRAAPTVAAAVKTSTTVPKAPTQNTQRLAKAEAAITRYVAFEPASGLAPVAMPHVSETDLFTSVQAVLSAPKLLPLRGLPIEIYQPGTIGAMPKVALALKLPEPTPVATPSPTFDVPEVSQTATVSETHPIEDLAAHEPDAHGAPVEETHADVGGHGEAATEEGGHGGGHGAPEVAEIVTPTAPAVLEDIAVLPNQTGEGEDLGLMFPAKAQYAFPQIMEALQAVADAPAGSTAGREARLSLAGIYLQWQRPEEAVAVLRNMPRRADGLPAEAFPRLLYGIASLAANREVADGVFDERGEMAKHAALWQAVAHAKQRNFSLAVQQWPREKGVLPDYPAYLRELAQQAQLEALLMTGQQEAAAEGAEAMIKSYPEGLTPPKLQRLKGLALLGSAREQEGLDALAKAAENTTDAETAMRAKFEFTRALHQRRDISDAQLRQYLETLQQDWRGDETEREMLSVLADLYEKNREPQKALQTWQTIVQSFPRTPELPLITSRMAQAFVNIYDPESEQVFDTLTYMGIYYDFRELLPNDETGDRVQEWVAERLVNANLFERAIPILEQQLNYRPLDDVARGRLTLLLAEANRKSRKPEEAVRLLDTNRALASTQTLRRGWALAEAHAMGDLQRPQAGLAILEPLLTAEAKDKEVKQLAADLAWQGQDWATTTTLLTETLAPIPASVLVSDTAAQLSLFRLAYALGQQNKAADLATLKARYKEAWPQLPRLADDVNAVAASAGVEGVSPEGGAMQALTTALSSLNALDDTIARTRSDMQKTRTTREEYNRRMDYMDLLPPPAI